MRVRGQWAEKRGAVDPEMRRAQRREGMREAGVLGYLGRRGRDRGMGWVPRHLADTFLGCFSQWISDSTQPLNSDPNFCVATGIERMTSAKGRANETSFLDP